MFLRVRNEHIEKVRYITDGCFFTTAACSAAAKMAENRTVRECFRVNQSAILTELPAMPKDHEHCAYLAALTLQKALREYVKKVRECSHSHLMQKECMES